MLLIPLAPHRATMFTPSSSFLHPNGQSVVPLRDFTQLSQKLDTAERKVDEYARLIASLTAELRGYRDILCHTCRENIIRASLATSSPPNPTRSASQPITTPTILSEHNTTIQLETCSPSGARAAAESSLSAHHSSREDKQAQVHSPRQIGDSNPDGLIVTTPSHLPTTTSTPSTNAKPSQTEFPSISETAGPALPNPSHPQWSVEYNPETKQGLSLHIASTFTFSNIVLCVKFSCDGIYLAVGLNNGETHIYNTISGSKSTISVLARRSPTVFYTDVTQQPSKIWAVRFSLDNKYIAIVGDHYINIWEVARRQLRANFNHSFARCIDFSPNNRFLASVSVKSLFMWRLRDGSRTKFPYRMTQNFGFVSVAFSPDGQYIATANDDGLRIWDTRTCQLVTICNMIAGYVTMYQKPMIFTPDGNGIVIGGSMVHCWDLSSRRETKSGRHVAMNQKFKAKTNTSPITAVSFTSDHCWVVASSYDFNIYILDASSGAWACTLKGHKNRVSDADSSRAGHFIASGGDDRCVILWKYEVTD